MSVAPSAGLLAFTESAQKNSGAPLKHAKRKGKRSHAASRHAGAGRHKGKSAAVDFDEAARAEYLTGFQKRKAARKEAGRGSLRKKEREEQLASRKEAREARKQRARENLKADRRAVGLPSESEGEDEEDGGRHGDDHQDAAAVPDLQDESYDTDQHHTHVVVEPFDPEEEEKRQQAQQAHILAMSKEGKKEKEKVTKTVATVEALPPSSAKANKANAKSEEEESDADPPEHEQDPAQKRLHIAGLTEAFTAEELKQRFATFGRVVALDEWPGPRSASGQLRPFAYLTIEASGPQISRCINLLNGSMWKGAKLRVGEAKPDFRKGRLVELEKEQEAELIKPAKRKRLPGHIGIESSDMDPVTPQRVKEGLWGWKRTPAGHLIRPLHIRPEHPLPRPAPLKTKDGENVKGTRRPRANAVPSKRAKRITIDPTRYGAVHITGSMLDAFSGSVLDVSSLGPGEWQCEEIDEENDDAAALRPGTALTRLVRWRFVGKDGEALHEEFAKLPVRPIVVPDMTRTVPTTAAAAATATAALPSATSETSATVVSGHPEQDERAEPMDEDELSFGAEAQSDAGSDLFAGFPTSLPTAKEDDASEQMQTPAMAMGDASTRMQRLTEMFRPQEEGGAGKGFSLMRILGDDLDLELDDELDFAVEEENEVPFRAEDEGKETNGIAAAVTARGPHSWFDANPEIPLLFPSARSGPRSILDKLKEPQMTPLIASSAPRGLSMGFSSATTGANAVPVSSSTVGYVAFCRTETEAQLDEAWAARRVRLTKDSKKMHREAVRKKKTKFVGSKRATAVAAAGEREA